MLVATLLLATGANAAFEKVNTYENNFSDVSENNWFYENKRPIYVSILSFLLKFT
ncbi:MAG: hypothetical protein IJW06_01060 [Clostridia bacterium]|nr:hypothetical protein [Clostridia bacterium]